MGSALHEFLSEYFMFVIVGGVLLFFGFRHLQAELATRSAHKLRQQHALPETAHQEKVAAARLRQQAYISECAKKDETTREAREARAREERVARAKEALAAQTTQSAALDEYQRARAAEPEQPQAQVVLVEATSETEARRYTNQAQLTVVDFYAPWCGPCRQIAPHFERLAYSCPGVNFVKVNVDNVKPFATACGVRAMPTFVLFKGGREVARLQGGQMEALRTMVAQHM